MRFTSFISTALLFAASSFALPTGEVADLETRQSALTCGRYSYSSTRVAAAFRQGVNYYNNGQQVGNNNYPHNFNNREGFNFDVSGPYQNFPLLQSGNVYTGGSPGPDRVVFNTRGQYAGSITHTGASNNGFVACSDTT